jgi:hypothetical protein
MKTAMTADAIGRLSARPPALTGLSRKSPTVAPSGLVRMNAAQKRTTRDILVAAYSTMMTAMPAANTSAPPSYPKPVSAIQSPSAVPSVCEKVTAAQ